MLLLQSNSHAPLGVLPFVQNLKRTRDLKGTDDLDFNYAIFSQDNGGEYQDEIISQIKNQCVIQADDQEYVIKEVNPDSDNILAVVCEVNLEDLKSSYIDAFDRPNESLSTLMTNCLVGSGWTFETNRPTKQRSLAMTQSTILEVIKKIADTFMMDLRFDAKNKIIYIEETMGNNLGVFFNDKFNMNSLNIKQDTHDYCTRLIPIGKDGLTITEINDGLPYVENYQYTGQAIVQYWKADQYTDASALKEDAIKKLALLSMPKLSFDAKVIDLANISIINPELEDRPDLEYHLGDTVYVKDSRKNFGQFVRIVEIVDYPEDPSQNTVQFNSQYELMEDLFERNLKIADTVDSITTADGGSVDGDKVDSIDWTKVQNIQVETAQIKDLAVTEAKIADATITTAKIGDAQITNAKIADATIEAAKINTVDANSITTGTLDAERVTVINLNATNITTGTLNGNRIEAGTINADRLITGTITATSGVIDTAAITTAMIADLAVTGAKIANATIDTAQIANGAIKTALIDTGAIGTVQIADGSVTDAKVVDLSANSITAGTLSVDRLVIRGSEQSIIYEINNITGALQALSTDTLNGEILTERTITADKIVANEITANELASHTITANEIATNTITAESGIIASIDASKITTGTLDADLITVVNMLANKLQVKNTSNYTLVDIMPDTNGGRAYIYNNSGVKNVTLGSKGFSSSNVGGTLILHNDSESHRVEMGISSTYDSGNINLLDTNDVTRAAIYGDSNLGPTFAIMGSGGGSTQSRLTATTLTVDFTTVFTNGGLYHVGKLPAYSTNASLGSDDTVTINHYLGYHPIVQLDGSTGNLILTISHTSTNQLIVRNYSSGGNGWSGTIRLY